MKDNGKGLNLVHKYRLTGSYPIGPCTEEIHRRHTIPQFLVENAEYEHDLYNRGAENDLSRLQLRIDVLEDLLGKLLVHVAKSDKELLDISGLSETWSIQDKEE